MSAAAEVRGLAVHFPTRVAGRRAIAKAVDGVDLRVDAGEIVALVGESGCGKTTIARTVMRLEQPTLGQVLIEGEDVTRLRGRALRRLRSRFQMIFQDPFESLPANATVADVVEEGLRIHRRGLPATERRVLATAALESAGLDTASVVDSRMFQLSGGQRQRVAIAAAIVLEPNLIVADEPVSMLDVSLRAGVLNVLLELRARRGIAVLFITHDLSIAQVFADRVAVVYLGRIVEEGPADRVIRDPRHPYTRALVAVMPTTRSGRRGPRALLTGEAPNPTAIAPGCRFAPRCPLYRDLGEPARCRTDDPVLTGSTDHRVACHFAETAQAVPDPEPKEPRS